MIRVAWYALNRTNLNALRRIKMTHTFGAFFWVNHIIFDALRNGLVRAFRFTNVAIDALFCDQQSQASYSVTADAS